MTNNDAQTTTYPIGTEAQLPGSKTVWVLTSRESRELWFNKNGRAGSLRADSVSKLVPVK